MGREKWLRSRAWPCTPTRVLLQEARALGCAESTGLAKNTVWYGEYGEGEQTPGGGEAAARSMILHVQRTGLWLEATMWRRVWELAVS